MQKTQCQRDEPFYVLRRELPGMKRLNSKKITTGDETLIGTAALVTLPASQQHWQEQKTLR
jgi:hypothetical protein